MKQEDNSINEFEDHSKNFDIMRESLEDSKNDWFEKINKLFEMSSDFTKLGEVQILSLSYRHGLVDYTYGDLTKSYIRMKTICDKARKRVLLDTKRNYDFKLSTDKERSIVMDSDIRVLTEMSETIDSYITMYKDMIKTLDNMNYMVKNRIELYKVMNGDKL